MSWLAWFQLKLLLICRLCKVFHMNFFLHTQNYAFFYSILDSSPMFLANWRESRKVTENFCSFSTSRKEWNKPYPLPQQNKSFNRCYEKVDPNRRISTVNLKEVSKIFGFVRKSFFSYPIHLTWPLIEETLPQRCRQQTE